ncbi:DUF881 domain-containing protein [Abyssisolibacter fermentans]|uniref:DUF881 domain-containing protein n=1 Tax=Abyssisolibacter fermentans TaxID=1766203 RepID=UPI0008302F89|nr:DUF881 domain-containing protein [Abyssisolibacter fermentans]
MNNAKNKLALGIVCVFLGLIMSLQFKTVNRVVGKGQLISNRAKEYTIEYQKLQTDKEELTKQLDDLNEKIKKYEDSASKENVYVEELTKEKQKYKMIAGYENVEGPGIELIIDDPDIEVLIGDNTSYFVYNYDTIMTIISFLNTAEAEAISINGLRYTNYTEILPVGNHLNINGVSIGAPIEIKAIGPPDKLESALVFKGGIIDQLKRNELKVDLKQSDLITIQGYKKIMNFRYAKPVNGN